MGDPFADTPSSAKPPDDRLDSWKEIAAYLNRDMKTVQRWEKREGMPVHRHQHDRMGSVYAFRAELDAWSRSRHLRSPETSPPSIQQVQTPSTSNARWKWLFSLAAVGGALAVAAALWLQRTDYFWRSPIADARFQPVTDFEGVEQAAAVSRDGHFVAFLSDHDGPMDVWVTQVGSGQFHNLTGGRVQQLGNPSIRTLGFSPDGSFVTFWIRKPGGSSGDISIWSVPTLTGQPTLLRDGIAEFDWSLDGSRVVYHTPGSGDPMFVSNDIRRSEGHSIFTAAAGLHAHFPLWAPDSAFIYFVQGELADKSDIWRIPSAGGIAERITSHMGHVSHPVLLDRRTLMYLASDPDGSGLWLHSVDVERRISHRLTAGVDRYTSLAASGDGRRLVATVARRRSTLWRLRIGDAPAAVSAAARIQLTNTTGVSPRLGPNYLLYVATTGTSEGIWKLAANGTAAALWSGAGAHVFGGPAIAPDGRSIAFSIRQNGQSLLYVMHDDGTNARVVPLSLDLQGAPAWDPDGQSIISAADDHGVPHLFRLPIDGRPPVPFVQEYSIDPAWSSDGSFVVYSGADIGTTFSVKAVTADGATRSLPDLTLTRGARRLAFLQGGPSLVLLRGDLQHKNLWTIDLQSGAARQLTDFPPDFDIRDFDISPDGRDVVVERVQDLSDLVMLELPRP